MNGEAGSKGVIRAAWQPPGQRSPIHDHSHQRCWMGVLDGRVKEAAGQGPRRLAPRYLTPLLTRNAV